jgi:PleD family two-component response regulator
MGVEKPKFVLTSSNNYSENAQHIGVKFVLVSDVDGDKDFVPLLELQGKSVVLVDDRVPLLDARKRLFKLEGVATIHTFSDPCEALKEIPRLQPIPDVVLSDVDMPDMDGVTLMKELKKQFKT